ncbi:MAG: hypothetical protein FWG10_12150 [Eubacteriaceae bacterium]|nr:hypothetical protein [Eubacteriaceae bacterium]
MGNLIVHGVSKVRGGVYGLFSSNGEAVVDGGVECSILESSGTCNVLGNLKVEGKTKTVGALLVGGDFQTESFEMNGILEVLGTVDVEDFIGRGIVDFAGNATAKNFYFENEGMSKFPAIKAKRVKAISRHDMLSGTIEAFDESPQSKYIGFLLEVGEIVADEIDLEWVVAERVEGRVVRIGPGCVIGSLSYGLSLECSKEAQVGETKAY